MDEHEEKAATTSIRYSIFCADNMSTVSFLIPKGKSVTINDHDNHSPDVFYLTFRSSLNSHIVDSRAENAVH